MWKVTSSMGGPLSGPVESPRSCFGEDVLDGGFGHDPRVS